MNCQILMDVVRSKLVMRMCGVRDICRAIRVIDSDQHLLFPRGYQGVDGIVDVHSKCNNPVDEIAIRMRGEPGDPSESYTSTLVNSQVPSPPVLDSVAVNEPQASAARFGDLNALPVCGPLELYAILVL